tara:strand:+ start:686 stop:856 length:171 start_codon:yes stop_codon:yes gene_type:complete
MMAGIGKQASESESASREPLRNFRHRTHPTGDAVGIDEASGECAPHSIKREIIAKH